MDHRDRYARAQGGYKPAAGRGRCADGQIIDSDFRKSCQAKNLPKSKIFLFSGSPNQRYMTSIPSRQEGRIMIAVIVGRVAVDAGSADSERHESVRQRRVVLTSRCWRQYTWGQLLLGRNGGKRAVLRGEHVISRKAIAQGMSDVLRCPVCSCAHSFYPLHMRPRVQRASGIPCALCLERA